MMHSFRPRSKIGQSVNYPGKQLTAWKGASTECISILYLGSWLLWLNMAPDVPHAQTTEKVRNMHKKSKMGHIYLSIEAYKSIPHAYKPIPVSVK